MRAGCMLDMQGSRWSAYPALSVYPECSRRCERSCCRFARGSHRLRSLQASMLPSCGGDDAVKSSLVAPSSARREMLRALAAPEAGGSSETRLGRRHLALCGCRQLSVQFDAIRAGSLQSQREGHCSRGCGDSHYWPLATRLALRALHASSKPTSKRCISTPGSSSL